MPSVDEIAPDIFRVSIFAKEFGFSFNHFLVRDETPFLPHGWDARPSVRRVRSHVVLL
jgi:hypothetical protein